MLTLKNLSAVPTDRELVEFARLNHLSLMPTNEGDRSVLYLVTTESNRRANDEVSAIRVPGLSWAQILDWMCEHCTKVIFSRDGP